MSGSIKINLLQYDLRYFYEHEYVEKSAFASRVKQVLPTQEQAGQLEALLEKFHEAEAVIRSYSDTFYLGTQISAKRFPHAYKAAYDKQQLLETQWKSLQATLLKNYGFPKPLADTQPSPHIEALPCLTFPTPTKEAHKWRDIRPGDEHLEKIIRVVTTVIVILAILAVATAVYFCVTTSHTYTIKETGEIVTRSNEAFSIFPIIFGSIPTIIMGSLGYIFSFLERGKNGFLRESLDSQIRREDYAFFLMEGTLDQMVDRFYQKNGGLVPMVRRGLLTVSQGDRLRALIRRYVKVKKDLAPFEPFEKDLTERGEGCSGYRYLVRWKHDLETKWKLLQQEIKTNFSSDGYPEKPTAYPINLPNWNARSAKAVQAEVELPTEVLHHIFDYLLVGDLAKTALASKQFQQQAAHIQKQRAKEYGVDPEYLPELYQFIQRQAKRGLLPKHCVAKTPSGKINPEATLRNLRLLQGEERLEFKRVYGYLLLEYARKGDIKSAKAALALGAHLEMRDDEGNTPLFLAVQNNQDGMIDLLLDQGADTYAINHSGHLPIHIHHASTQNLIKLLEDGKESLSVNHPFNGTGTTPLHLAAQMNLLSRVTALLAHGANPLALNQSGQTADQLTINEDVRSLILDYALGMQPSPEPSPPEEVKKDAEG